MKYLLSAKKWFVKTLTRIVNYESRVVKWNPDKANVKIHYFTTWFTNDSSTHIAQYLATIIQNAKKYFSSKIMRKMRQVAEADLGLLQPRWSALWYYLTAESR